MEPNSIIIDWLSWTIPRELVTEAETTELHEQRMVWQDIRLWSVSLYHLLLNDPEGWTPGRGRPPYSSCYRSEHGIAIYHSPVIDNILIEISGRGMEWIRAHQYDDFIMQQALERVTRFDVAVDVISQAQPSEIVRNGVSGRFKSHSHVTSETGETQYVGSRKSDRYLRIYRYNEPHPRAHLLRYEFVFRKQMAKDALAAFITSQHDLRGMMAYCGQTYGINHHTYNTDARAIPVELYRPERHSASTVLWITGAVAPAFKRLLKEGVISDPEQFLKEHFL